MNIENPTVYTTDHEVFFDDIEIMGTLEDYFNLFVSDKEYITTMKKFVTELRTK